MEMLLAIPFGVAIGLVVGTVGGGGAILALPVLVYGLDQGVSSASTASLIVVALGASVGAGSQARNGHLCWRVAFTFSAPAAVGAYVGTIANTEVSPRTLVLMFVPVMLAAAVLTYRRGDDGCVDEDVGDCPDPSLRRAGGAGFVIGLMTGFFGVGGGFVIVPALVLALGFTMAEAVGTSLLVITINSAVALSTRLQAGAIEWKTVIPFTLASLIGVIVGSRLASKHDSRSLQRWFVGLLVVVAIYTAVRSGLALR